MATPETSREVLVDDSTTADEAYRLARDGQSLIWQGDFQNAKQLLNAMARRFDKKSFKKGSNITETFHRYRQSQGLRAKILNQLFIKLENGYKIPLKRAPDVYQACLEAYGSPTKKDLTIPLRELLGIIGAHEWRKKGVEVAALGERIHPHYGVFAPIRGEYVNLVATAPLPSTELAFDIGTGTGVLAAVLAKRGVQRIVATDHDPRAITCAKENFQKLGYLAQITLLETSTFPEGKSPLIVCNPPWLPGRPTSLMENAIFDFENQMLKGFLSGLSKHLTTNGEGWLIISDLAEHLGLRSREQLLKLFDESNLKVIDRLDTKPTHKRATDPDDPLSEARSKETTSLWRLSGK